jgi:hypothetical protein
VVHPELQIDRRNYTHKKKQKLLATTHIRKKCTPSLHHHLHHHPSIRLGQNEVQPENELPGIMMSLNENSKKYDAIIPNAQKNSTQATNKSKPARALVPRTKIPLAKPMKKQPTPETNLDPFPNF